MDSWAMYGRAANRRNEILQHFWHPWRCISSLAFYYHAGFPSCTLSWLSHSECLLMKKVQIAFRLLWNFQACECMCLHSWRLLTSGTSDERRATSDEGRATRDERQATSDEGQATSDDERRGTSDKRRATSDERQNRHLKNVWSNLSRQEGQLELSNSRDHLNSQTLGTTSIPKL